MRRGEPTETETVAPSGESLAGEPARLVAALGPVAVVAVEAAESLPGGAATAEVGGLRVDGAGAALVLQVRIGSDRPPGERGAPPPGRRGALVHTSGWSDVVAELGRWIGGAALVGHDLERLRFLSAGAIRPERFSGTCLDALELACIVRPELAAHDVATLVREVLGRERRPGALGQAADVLHVLVRLHEEIEGGEHEALRDVLDGLESPWSWRALFGAGVGWGLGPLGRSARRAPRSRARSGGDAGVSAFLDGARADAGLESPATLLRDQARLRREIPGYRLREEQVELAEAIGRAFGEERALAIEAGTGIGKTLGYALAAFLHAAGTGERVVISSANRTLQERVVQEELPAIARALGRPPLHAVVLKGRANYGSPSRARDVARGTLDAGCEDLSVPARLYLASYFARCPWRDLRLFGGWLAEREPGLRAVRERIACSAECDPRACRAEPGGACGYLSRVDALAEASVVSINHSLLLSWPARYGPIERLIVDEAHELVGEGDRAFAETLQARELRGALRRVRTHPKRGLIGVLAARAGRREILEQVDARVALAEAAIEALGARLAEAAGTDQVRVPPATLLPADGPWADVLAASERLATHLGRLAALIEEVAPPDALDEDGPYGASRGDAIQREAGGLARLFQNAAGGVLGDLFVQSREDHVYAARAERRGGDRVHQWSLTVTPLDAAELIHARVLEPAKTVVALSATLGVGGDPGPTLDKLGWGLLPRDRRLAPLVLASPFDFANHAVLALARGSHYRESRFEEDCARATAAIVRLLGGRTMALFTSRRRMYGVASRLREMLRDDGIPLLVQPADGGAAALVERFAAAPRAVLLGTRSLWQGVDIPGEALSCVIIDKLPFPQPGEPLLRGRQARLRALGEDAFAVLSLEPAVVLFKQMFGRLIRSETDRGFVVVLGADTSKGYIDDFVRSLPGPPRVIVDGIDAIVEEMRIFFELKADAAAR